MQDTRTITFTGQRQRVEFKNVSAQIRPETASLNAGDLRIIEQNFDYDLLSPAKIMENAVGQTITLVRTNPATGAETREQVFADSEIPRPQILRIDHVPRRAGAVRGRAHEEDREQEQQHDREALKRLVQRGIGFLDREFDEHGPAKWRNRRGSRQHLLALDIERALQRVGTPGLRRLHPRADASRRCRAECR